jgi:spore maturation protein A
MLNYIWFAMLVIGFVVGMINGRINEVTNVILESSKDAIMFSINLLGIICIWSGLMKIAEKSGLIRAITKGVKPLFGFLFPKVPKGHPSLGAMAANLIANVLGLGNAATPLGLKAISELQKINPLKDTVTNEISMFLILNSISLQLIPTSIIAIRSHANSKNPTEIMFTIWIVSAFTAIAGLISAKCFSSTWKIKRGN